MNRRTPLLTTPDLQISRFDHPPGFEHRDPGDEVCDSYEVSFVERGGFHVVAGGRTWQPAAGDMFLTSPGLRYRCYHAEAFPGDVCLTISYRDALKPSREPALTSFAGRPPIVTGDNRLAYLHWRLATALAAPEFAMTAETIALDVLAALAAPRGAHRRYRYAQLVWYGERIQAAKEILTRRATRNIRFRSWRARWG
ncbi:MAG TPA: hypothetical protein VK473_17410 [Terriglobales bacterium]|nr:hypothetical protein [Terriglobales bacterium]